MNDNLPHPPLKLFIVRDSVGNVHFYPIYTRSLLPSLYFLALSTWIDIVIPGPIPKFTFDLLANHGRPGRRPLLTRSIASLALVRPTYYTYWHFSSIPTQIGSCRALSCSLTHLQ